MVEQIQDCEVRTDPQVQIGVVGKPLRQLLDDCIAVHGHPHDVPEQYPHDHGLLLLIAGFFATLHLHRGATPFQTPFGNYPQPRSHLFHEKAVGGTQTQHVAPQFGPADNLPHFPREPIIVPLGRIGLGVPSGLGSLMDLPHHPPARHVPLTVMKPVVMPPQDVERGLPDVRQSAGRLILDFVPRRLRIPLPVAAAEALLQGVDVLG
mmetsp:Transcript_12902/g.37849  ORF Transcript_12902/g.37849 Transcript_12902/m.37849 type:complete len:207 (+) Transcript_12902:192-812(+)